MRVAAPVSTLKEEPTLGASQVEALRKLTDNERSEALKRLGINKIRAAVQEWKAAAGAALLSARELSAGRSAFMIAATRDERRAYDAQIKDANDDLDQAESIVATLNDFLECAANDAITGALVARAQELCKVDRDGIFRRLHESLQATGAILAEINQHNGEALAINPHLPADCERIPILDVKISGMPGQHSFVRWLSSELSSHVINPTVAVAGPGSAAYPAPVKAALAKLEEKRCADIAAAHGARRGSGPGILPVGYGLPRFADQAEPVASESAPKLKFHSRDARPE